MRSFSRIIHWSLSLILCFSYLLISMLHPCKASPIKKTHKQTNKYITKQSIENISSWKLECAPVCTTLYPFLHTFSLVTVHWNESLFRLEGSGFCDTISVGSLPRLHPVILCCSVSWRSCSLGLAGPILFRCLNISQMMYNLGVGQLKAHSWDC